MIARQSKRRASRVSHFIASAVAAMTLSTASYSATIELDTVVDLSAPSGDASVTNHDTFDSLTDGAKHYISDMTSLPFSDVDGYAASGVDLDLGASRARARIEKAPNSGKTKGRSAAMTRVRETYSVTGNGTAYAAFTIYGDILSTTDLDDPGQFLEAFGSVGVNHNGDAYLASFSTQLVGDTYFELANGSYNRKLVIEFDVLDGDVFDIATLIKAEIAFPDFVSAGARFDVDVKSGLRVYGSDGVAITPDAPAPVPLPASIAFLATPIAGLWVMRRRQRVR